MALIEHSQPAECTDGNELIVATINNRDLAYVF